MQKLRNKLLEWYEKNKRNLPWRNSRDPYKIWVSEIMLQQTQVDTVVPYYEKFLMTFPTIRALADADSQLVLKVWEGLGYYSRARNMHKAAKLICSEYGGKFPDHLSHILKLPGIGNYTAGAIASIAFRRSVPVVDGNIKRVFARFFLIESDITSAESQKQFWQLASDLIPESSPGTFNQALMELGALICLPKNPHCGSCPVSSGCKAREHNRQYELPFRKKKSPVPHFQIGAGLIWRGTKLLISRRPENGLLGGLWEFPGGKQEKHESIEECVRREIFEELGVRVRVKERFMTVNHAYSHFRITLHVFHCDWISGEPACRACTDFKWVAVNLLPKFPFPRANKRIVDQLVEGWLK